MSKDDEPIEDEEVEPEEFSEEDIDGFDEAELDDEFDVDALGDDDLADELGDDDLTDELAEDLAAELVGEIEEEEIETVPLVVPASEEEDFEEDELDPDDVEASLDDILKDRLVIEDAEIDEDDTPDTDDRGEGISVVVPKRPDEFVCQLCFLVKHPGQIADVANQYCKDCV